MITRCKGIKCFNMVMGLLNKCQQNRTTSIQYTAAPTVVRSANPIGWRASW